MYRPRLQVRLVLFLLVFLCVENSITTKANDLPKVDFVWPRDGSINGATSLTVKGKNFGKPGFSAQGNETGPKFYDVHVGNYDCKLHQDGTHETQIVCYTRPMPEGKYDVTVSIRGQPVQEDRYCTPQSRCQFTVSRKHTPTITKVTPPSGLPGQVIRLDGKLFTAKYGSDQPDDLKSQIIRVYFGGQECKLKNNVDHLYGLELTSSYGNGFMKCKPDGTFIGNNKITYLVTNAYGRSLADGKTKYVRNNGVSMYQTFTEIESLSLRKGSTKGGTMITVIGKHFDETKSDAKVLIAGEPCKITEPVTDTKIVCETPADVFNGTAHSHFIGGRGFNAYVYPGIIDAGTINKSVTPFEHLDSSSWTGNNMKQHTVLMVGYFVPPSAGNYSFCIKAASSAKVYVSTDGDPANKKLKSQGTSTCGDIMSYDSLEKGQSCYIEVHYQSSKSNSYVTMVANVKETQYSEDETAWAKHEIQKLKIVGRTDAEIQELEVTASGNTSQTADVQTLVIYGERTATFAVGLSGIFTTAFSLDSLEAAKVETALKELPGVVPDIQVQVQSQSDTRKTLLITTNSNGIVGPYEVVQLTGSISFINSRTTPGVEASNYFMLSMNGSSTSALELGSSANEVRKELQLLFSVQCHPRLREGTVTDYEHRENWMSEIVSDTEPFCGRYSVKNTKYIYRGKLQLSAYKSRFLCLAYKGLGGIQKILVNYEAVDEDGKTETKKEYIIFKEVENLAKWNYWCTDIFQLLRNRAPGTLQYVRYVRVYKKNPQEDLYIDQLGFRKDLPLAQTLFDKISVWRKRQVQPNGYFIDTMDVKKTGNKYNITLKPHHCGHDLPLFEALQGDVKRIQAASYPIKGSYRISFNDDTTDDIPITVKADVKGVADFLALTKMGFSQVNGEGTCSEFSYTIKMLSQTGDQPLMSLDTSKLTGPDVTSEVTTVQNGGLWMEPIMGDLLRTHEKNPGVIAFINDIPTRCANGYVCTFVYSADSTPNVMNVKPQSASQGTTVTITGSGFETANNGADNKVTFGNTPCTVTGATVNSITCTVRNGPTGTVPVIVNVKDKGFASGSVDFTFITNVTSLLSESGSTEGGTTLTLKGYGFTPDAEVKVEGKSCGITRITESLIECITPRSASPTGATVDVKISQMGSELDAGNFTYSVAYTPVITSINVSSSAIAGGEKILISGTGFGNDEMQVTLGGKNLTLTSYSDTEIIAVLPSLPHGNYSLFVNVEGKGYANLRNNAVPDISYNFVVNSMYPVVGSLYGGTDIFIEGQGFQESLLNIHIGNHSCVLTKATSSSIKCRIAETSTHHNIFANGTHKYYGIGFAWDKSVYTVNVGDTVTWHWDAPFYFSDVKYSVRQTTNANDLKDMPGGFSSGKNTRKGSFRQRFNIPGIYHYWTSYLDSGQVLYFRGKLNVMPLKSISHTLSVKMLGTEAFYNTAASGTTPSFSCQETVPLKGCNETASFENKANKFNFKFHKCFSPHIDSLSPVSGSFDDIISMSGNGYGSQTCQNEVIYGKDGCTTIVNSSHALNFKISPSCEPPVGELHKFKVRVHNLGYALMSLPLASSDFGLIPSVDSITPYKGSKVGGTKVTISGAGFTRKADNIYVELQKLYCKIESVSNTKIICKTECASNPDECFIGEMPFSVNVAHMTAKCTSTCKFETTNDDTPEVDSITPSSVSSGSTVLTVVGTKLPSQASDLSVLIGDVECSVFGPVNETHFTCTVGRLPVGDNKVIVYVSNLGNAATTVVVKSEKIASINSPSISGIHGGATLVISGNGFVKDKTNVQVGGKECLIMSIDLSEIKCTLPAQPEKDYNVVVNSNGHVYPTLSINYTLNSTPNIKSISPTYGRHNEEIQISGQNFDSPSGSMPEVKIGEASCSVSQQTATLINCTTGVQRTGKFAVQVFVPGKGISNNDVQFTYKLSPFTINPQEGSTNGGQLITLSGSGFLENATEVKICGKVCEEVSVTSSTYVCKTPEHTATVCDVVAEVQGIVYNNSSAYTYNAKLLSTITSIKPNRGGTGGGDVITITGTNFGIKKAEIQVKIAQSSCDVQTLTDTEIICRTKPSIKSVIGQVEVQKNGKGLAKQISATFEYIDVWSSIYTWGGNPPPGEGYFVIIKKGQKILLDQSTPILDLLLIQGGHLVFDEADLELQAKQILITDGGILEVGTASKPFQHKAIITLHGHVRSKELPIYGAKGIGVREGFLELHGKEVPVTWTKLDKTAVKGSSIIHLTHSVDWPVGSEIVIVTTGDRSSQKETEVKSISSINKSGTEITLDSQLKYEHIATEASFGSRNVEFKAEVGLLTRNIVIRGNRNTQFDHDIKACPNGFNPGEFATQTCFQGRYGEEIGSDQYGAQILIHQAEKDTQVAQAHIEYVEFTHAGQAFRLGRYPIHFHLNGNMSKSYVRGCAIHHTFNRGVNIHGSHNIMVEHNVLYNIMGGALFLEDGDETGNTFQYNLQIFVRTTSSLRNDDLTPAGIWATNPYNFIRHNTIAGGTHFGIWYRMHKHPDGPGYTPHLCPATTPFGEYRNNTVHSVGRFGLWIFESYIPKDSPYCTKATRHTTAKFYFHTAWNNEEGAEAVLVGAVQFHNFVLVNNQRAGIKFSLIGGNPPQYDEKRGPGVFNSVIVAHHKGLRGRKTGTAIIQPYFNGFLMKGVEFYNFDQGGSNVFAWVRIAGICVDKCGGFTTAASNLRFINSPRKVKFAWENEGIIHDLDGSLTGKAGASVAACSGSFDPSKCVKDGAMSMGYDGCVCSKDVKLFRFGFNKISPNSLIAKDALFKSEFGTTRSIWKTERIINEKGWQAVLMANQSYELSFKDADHTVNISYSGKLTQFSEGDYLIITQNAYQMPDIVKMDGKHNLPMSRIPPSESNFLHGTWHYNATISKISYALQNSKGTELPVEFRVNRCFFRGCKPPPSVMSVIKEPTNAEYTSNPATWKNLTIHGNAPQPLDDLYIASDRWIVVDTVLPKLGKVVIDGGLQFSENFTQQNLLEADYILIRGRLVAGWSDENPFRGNLIIRLRGQHSTPNYKVLNGPNLGSKFIGVFGGLQLHGISRISKTYLALEASVGDSSITVKDNVDWKVGEDILISTTNYNAWDTEVFQITAVSGKTLTLNGTIKHRHIAQTEHVNGRLIQLSASVALLTRNIRVEGAEYNDLIKESFGATIIVSQSVHNGKHLIGFAQVSNVEFYHCGQEGFTSSYDARYALTYMAVTSTKGKVRYSYAKQNAFHSGFSPAIGVFGTDGIEIDQNTVHHTVGPGIQTNSAGTAITNNLVTLSIWPGAYLNRAEEDNFDFPGAIDGLKATRLVLINNTVAGSERAGYTLPGQPCNTAINDLWTGNMAHGTQSGFVLLSMDKVSGGTCTTLNGFTFWKNYDYGIYFINSPSLIVKNSVFVENGIGIAPFITGPNSGSHAYADKSFTVENNIFIGKTSSFSETLDRIPSDENVALSSMARGLASRTACGKIAILIGTFTSGANGSPRKPWLETMAYPTIKGVTNVKENIFKSFGSCNGGKSRDHILVTNKFSDDVIHPVIVSESTLIDVDKTSKILFHVPNVGKVNPTDCVDMDCDGHKKCLVTDIDGSFLGFIGNVLPNSAYEWDGNPKHGVGNNRIPSNLLTTPDGKKLDPNQIAPHKGLYKIDECKWIKEWVAYECNNTLEWRMLVPESLDGDTETRRLSPIAIYNHEGYLDLVNGPQDQGWCNGYTCLKRLSTFPILVALDQSFKIILTGSNPRRMRFMIINAKPTDCVRLSMYYTTINRIEVRVNNKFMMPNNGFYDKNNKFRFKFEQFKGELMPKVENKTVGENFISHENQTVTWIQCGGAEVLLTRLDALLVSFTLPEMTVDEFYGEKMVYNLASFLKIDPKKVRVVNIVQNTSPSGKRKKRSTATSTVFIEISEEPDEARSIDYTEIINEIIKMVQLGSVKKALKVDVLYTSIAQPDSDTKEPIVIQRPGKLVLEIPPQGLVVEDTPFMVQPKLKVIDEKGDVVKHLGSSTLVWEIEATIKMGGTARSSLLGTTRLNFTEGWANFTDLSINDPGDDYILEFKVVAPQEATKYSIKSTQIQIIGRSFRLKASLLTTKRLTNSPIKLEVGLVDKVTNLDFTHIDWDNHTWEAEMKILDSKIYTGALSGTSKVTFDPITGKAIFSNIILDKTGNCPMLVTVKSHPEHYKLKMVVNIDVVTPDQASIVVTKSAKIELKFPITYNEQKALVLAAKVQNAYSNIPGMKITKLSHRQGSLIIIMYIEANDSGYNKTLTAMCDDVENGKNVTFDGTEVVMSPYITVDDKPYYGVSCGPIEKHQNDGDDDTEIKYIVVIAVLSVIVLILIVFLIYRRFTKSESKSHAEKRNKPILVSGYNNKNDLISDVLLREESSSSLKSSRSAVAPMPAKSPSTPFDLTIKTPRLDPAIRTPSPAW